MLTDTHSHAQAGAALQALDGARARFGAPPLDAARRSTFELRGSFLLAGAALQALDGARARFGAPPLDAARRSTFEPRASLQPRGSFLLAGAALQALDGARARLGAPPRCCQAQHFGASGRCPSAFRGPPPRCCQAQHFGALDGARARFGAPPPRCCQAQHFGASRLVSAGRQHFRLWTVPERVSGPPPLDAARRSTLESRGSFLLAGAALQALDSARAHFGASRLVSAGRGSTSGSARFCWQAQHFGASGRCPSAFRGPPPLMLPGAALSSLGASRLFCWQGQHFRLWTVPERVSGPPPRCCQAQHFGASRLVSAGRGSTSGSGRCPSAFRGPPPDAARRSTFEPRGSFLLAGAALCPSAFRGPPPRCCQAQHFRASSLFAASRLVSAARARFGAPPLDAARRSTFAGASPGLTLEPRGSFLLAGGSTSGSGRCPSAFRGPPPSAARRSTFSRLVSAGSQHFRSWTVPAHFGACTLEPRLAARFCWQGQHFRLWTVPERVSGPPPLDAARRSTLPRSTLDGGRRVSGPPPPGSGRCPNAFRGPPPLDAARRSTLEPLDGAERVSERVSGRPPLEPRGSFLLAGAALCPSAFRGPPPRCCQAQHFQPRASLHVSAGRGSTQALDGARAVSRPSFLLAGAALQALDGARARFGAPPLDAARRSTFSREPRGSFLLAGAALQALDGARGPPPPRCCQAQALWPCSLAARFCWQGQHFRLWTVPERVSRRPPLMLPGAALWSLAAAARRSTLEPLDGRFCWQGQHFRLWSVPERVRGPPPRCCQAQHFGASRLVSAGRGSTSAPLLDSARRSTWEPGGSGSGVVAARTRTFSQFKLGARRPFLPPLPALAFERCCKPSGLLVSASA